MGTAVYPGDNPSGPQRAARRGRSDNASPQEASPAVVACQRKDKHIDTVPAHLRCCCLRTNPHAGENFVPGILILQFLKKGVMFLLSGALALMPTFAFRVNKALLVQLWSAPRCSLRGVRV